MRSTSAVSNSNNSRPTTALTLTNFNPTRGNMTQVTVQPKKKLVVGGGTTATRASVSAGGSRHNQLRSFGNTMFNSSSSQNNNNGNNRAGGGMSSMIGSSPLITVEINRNLKQKDEDSNGDAFDTSGDNREGESRRLWSREDRSRAHHQSQLVEVEAELQQRIDLHQGVPAHVNISTQSTHAALSKSMNRRNKTPLHYPSSGDVMSLNSSLLPPRPSTVGSLSSPSPTSNHLQQSSIGRSGIQQQQQLPPRSRTPSGKALFPIRHSMDFSIQPQVRDLHGQLRPLTVINTDLWKTDEEEGTTDGRRSSSASPSLMREATALTPTNHLSPLETSVGNSPSQTKRSIRVGGSSSASSRLIEECKRPASSTTTIVDSFCGVGGSRPGTNNATKKGKNSKNDPVDDVDEGFLYKFEVDRIRRKQYRDLVRHQRKIRNINERSGGGGQTSTSSALLLAESSDIMTMGGHAASTTMNSAAATMTAALMMPASPAKESDKLKQQILDLGGSIDEYPSAFCTPRREASNPPCFGEKYRSSLCLQQHQGKPPPGGTPPVAMAVFPQDLMMQGITMNANCGVDARSDASSELSDTDASEGGEEGSSRHMEHSFGTLSTYVPGNDILYNNQHLQAFSSPSDGPNRRTSHTRVPDIYVQQFDVSGSNPATSSRRPRRRSLIELAPDSTPGNAGRLSMTPTQSRRLSSQQRRKSEDTSSRPQSSNRNNSILGMSSGKLRPLLPPPRTSSDVKPQEEEAADETVYQRHRRRSDFFQAPQIERSSSGSRGKTSPAASPPLLPPARRASSQQSFLGVSTGTFGGGDTSEVVGYGFDAYNKLDYDNMTDSLEGDSFSDTNSMESSTSLSDNEEFFGATRTINSNALQQQQLSNENMLDIVHSVEDFFVEHDDGLVSQARDANELLPLDGIPIEARVLRSLYKASLDKSSAETDPLDEEAHRELKQIAVETLRREGNEKAAMFLEQQITQEQQQITEKHNKLLNTLSEVMSFDCTSLVRYEGKEEEGPPRKPVTSENDTNMPPQELHLYQMYCYNTNTVIMFRPTSSAVPSMYAGNFFVPNEYCDESGIPKTVEEIPGDLCFEDVRKFTTSECRIKGKGIGVSLKSSPYPPIEGFIPLNPNLSKTYSEARKKERLLEDNLIRATDKISTALLKKIRSQRSMLGAATSVAMQEIVASMRDSDSRMEALLEQYRREASLCVDKELIAINYISQINEAQFLGKTIATWRGMELYYRHVPQAAVVPKSKFVSGVRETVAEKPAGDEEVERNGDGVPIFYAKRGSHLFSYNTTTNELNDAVQHALTYATSNAASAPTDISSRRTSHTQDRYPFHINDVKENLHPVFILTHRSFVISPMTKRIESDPLGDFIIGPDFDGFAHASKMPIQHLTNPTAYAHEFCEKSVQIANVPSMGLVTPLDKNHILETRLLSGWMQNHGYECCNTVKTQEISEGGHVVVLPTMEVRILHTFPDIVHFYREAWARGYPLILNPNWKVVLDNETLFPIAFGDELSMPIVGDCGSALVNHAVTSEGKTVDTVKAEAKKYLVELLAQKKGLGGARAHRSLLFGQYHVTTQMAGVIAKKNLAEKFYALRRWLLMPPHLLHLEVVTRKWVPAEPGSPNNLFEGTQRRTKRVKRAEQQLHISTTHSSRVAVLPATMQADELEPRDHQQGVSQDASRRRESKLLTKRDVSFIPCSAEFEEYRSTRLLPLLFEFEEGCEDFDVCFVDDCGRFTKMLRSYVDYFVLGSARGRKLRDAMENNAQANSYTHTPRSDEDEVAEDSKNLATTHSSFSTAHGSQVDLKATMKKQSSFYISPMKPTKTSDKGGEQQEEGGDGGPSNEVEGGGDSSTPQYVNPFAASRGTRSGGAHAPAAKIDDSQLPDGATTHHQSGKQRSHQLVDAQLHSMSIRGGGSNAGMLFDKLRRAQMKQENRNPH